MDPRELTLFVSAVANTLYECLPAGQLAVLAAVLTQLGDTLETLAVQAAFLEKEGAKHWLRALFYSFEMLCPVMKTPLL